MRPLHVAGLVVLAAIWGGSFVLMRVLVGPLGPLATAAGRALVAGLALCAYELASRRSLQWRRFRTQYLVVAAVNSAVPFALFGFAAHHLPASYSAILNSTSPLFGACFSALWLGERLTVSKVGGLVLGCVGVAAIVGVGAGAPHSALFGLSVVACLVAAVCYALAATYLKLRAEDARPSALAAATQVLAGLMLLPFVPLDPPAGPITGQVLGLLLLLAVSASAVAYLVYFRLVADLGPTRALTVTFLMPVFGLLFGAVFLGERITAPMLAGCVLVVAGTALVLRPGAGRSAAATRARAAG